MSATASQYEWQNVTMNAAWAPRDGAGALVFDNKMWLLGGWNPSDSAHFPKVTNNEVWSSTNGANWSLVKPNTFIDGVWNPGTDWEGRHTAGYAVLNDKMWIIGGDPVQGHYQSDVWNSSDGQTWTHVNLGQPVPWGPRILQYTVAFNDKLWIIGGQTTPQFAPASEVFYRDIWNSSDGVNWQQVQPQEPFWPQRGMIGGAVVFNDRMWVLGGGTYDTPQTPQRKFFNDVWSSADGVHWTQSTAQVPWAPREYHDIAVFDNKMWVMEGYNGTSGNRKDVWYSDDGVNWTELPNTPWNPRHAASVYVYDNALWMVAGNNMQRDVWKLVRTDLMAGDLDFDNDVDLIDYGIFKSHWLESFPSVADLNNDGRTDLFDWALFRSDYDKFNVGTGNIPPSMIPEPGPIALLAAAMHGSVFFGRRRSKSPCASR